jgi:hypothetical protein
MKVWHTDLVNDIFLCRPPHYLGNKTVQVLRIFLAVWMIEKPNPPVFDTIRFNSKKDHQPKKICKGKVTGHRAKCFWIYFVSA